ncbi:helix-turn-helix domain-containing protein [Cellulomonas sp. 179-A 4D5 NHS]|uniref:helix-turn-helix domain-containing protein n=1 Tax=Cellulomonas sp. 179-A 4D5 NHS TaxID=3142378 RepID=UPI0039A004B3
MTAHRKGTLVQERESTPEGRMAMAGARAAVGAVTLINRALDVSRLSQTELSRILDVTPGRVSQVVNGDGNLRVSTLARFLRAAGYTLKLTAEPAEPGVTPLPEPGSRRAKSRPAPRYATTFSVMCATEDGVGPVDVIQLSSAHPSRMLDRPKTYSMVLDLVTGKHEAPAAEVSTPAEAAQPVPVHHA